MQQQFEILTATRNNLINTIEGLTLTQLNTIPPNFKNNVIWNVGHIAVTQQLLCYKLSGLDMLLDEDFVDRFKKGSEAVNVVQEELVYIKAQLLSLPRKLQEDYNDSIFKNYIEYTTSYNVILNNIEEAIQFNNVHEGLHFGYIMALKKFI